MTQPVISDATRETANVGVVIIGRNEGENLRQCIRSVGTQSSIVYVDSGSTDGSPEAAAALEAAVVALDMSRPFTAARARNAGLARLVQEHPAATLVQFIDGDCVLESDWLAHASKELAAHPEWAAVCGHLRERFPEASLYNRICDMEWNGPVGEIDACGGVAMYRIDGLLQVRGFDGGIRAGEEPELCLRLRQRGGKIVRMDLPMARHDAGMLHFGQWWRRVARNGEGNLEVRCRTARAGRIFDRDVRKARLWGIGLPASILCAWIVSAALWGAGIATLVALAMGLAAPLRALRIGLRSRSQLPTADALLYGLLMVISDWPSLQGQWRFVCGRKALTSELLSTDVQTGDFRSGAAIEGAAPGRSLLAVPGPLDGTPEQPLAETHT